MKILAIVSFSTSHGKGLGVHVDVPTAHVEALNARVEVINVHLDALNAHMKALDVQSKVRNIEVIDKKRDGRVVSNILCKLSFPHIVGEGLFECLIISPPQK